MNEPIELSVIELKSAIEFDWVCEHNRTTLFMSSIIEDSNLIELKLAWGMKLSETQC